MKTILRLLPVVAVRRGLFIEAVIGSALAQIAVLGVGLGMAWTVGHALAGRPVSLPIAGFAFGGLAVFAALVAWRESWVSHDLAYRLIGILRGRLFDALRRSLPARSGKRRTGDLTATVVADVETLEWLYAHTAAQALSALLILSVGSVVSIAISPLLLSVWAPLLVVGVGVPLLTAKRSRRDGAALAAASASLRAELLDTVRGLRELNGSGALGAQVKRLDAVARALARTQVREASRLGAERGVADLAVALAALGAVLIVMLNRGAVAPELIPLAVTVAVAGLGPAAQIADLLRNAGTLRAAAERVEEVLARPAAVEQRATGEHPVRPRESGLVFDQVCFSYDGDNPVLDRFSLRARPGEIVALTGVSGVGKTTAARLALRLWDPDDGAVRIDGVDLRELPDRELRGLVAAVPQSSPLLRGDIRSNIALADPDASEAAIRAAAEAAGGLDAAAGPPRGLDTVVGEHGTGLSGGQRARVAVARALLRNPRVLVLDEPTASLDPEADSAIMELLGRNRDRAVLLIAHRPATVAAASRRVRLGSRREPGLPAEPDLRSADD